MRPVGKSEEKFMTSFKNSLILIGLFLSLANLGAQEDDRSLQEIVDQNVDGVIKGVLTTESLASILSTRILFASPPAPPVPEKDTNSDAEQWREQVKIVDDAIKDFQRKNPGFNLGNIRPREDFVEVCTEFEKSTVGIEYSSDAEQTETVTSGVRTIEKQSRSMDLVEAPSPESDASMELDSVFSNSATRARRNSSTVSDTDNLKYYYIDNDIICKNKTRWRRAVVYATTNMINVNKQVLAGLVIKRSKSRKEAIINNARRINEALRSIGANQLFKAKISMQSSKKAFLYEKQNFLTVLRLFSHPMLHRYESEAFEREKGIKYVTEQQVRLYLNELRIFLSRTLPQLLDNYQFFKRAFPVKVDGKIIPENRNDHIAMKTQISRLWATIEKLGLVGNELKLKDVDGDVIILNKGTVNRFIERARSIFVGECLKTTTKTEERCVEDELRAAQRNNSISEGHFQFLRPENFVALDRVLRPNQFPKAGDEVYFLRNGNVVDESFTQAFLRVGQLKNRRGRTSQFLQAHEDYIEVDNDGVSDENIEAFKDFLMKKQSEGYYPLFLEFLSKQRDGKIKVEIQFYYDPTLPSFVYETSYIY